MFIYKSSTISIKENNLPKKDIIVFTGEGNRIHKGINLQKKFNTKLLITGVNRSLSKETLLAIFNKNGKIENKKIVLDYKAMNTKQNVQESIKWLESINSNNFILITNNYHILRSLKEFKKLNNNITIHPHTTKTKLHYIKKLKKYIEEYMKYLISYFL